MGRRRLGSPVPAGAPLFYASIVPIADLQVSPGRRAMGIEISGAHALEGLLVPGDRVDVLVARPRETEQQAPQNLPVDPMQALGQMMQQGFAGMRGRESADRRKARRTPPRAHAAAADQIEDRIVTNVTNRRNDRELMEHRHAEAMSPPDSPLHPHPPMRHLSSIRGTAGSRNSQPARRRRGA